MEEPRSFYVGGKELKNYEARRLAYLKVLSDLNILPTVEKIVDIIERNPNITWGHGHPMGRMTRDDVLKTFEETYSSLEQRGLVKKDMVKISTKKFGFISSEKEIPVYYPTEETIRELKLDDKGHLNYILIHPDHQEEYTPETAAEISTTIDRIKMGIELQKCADMTSKILLSTT